MSETQLLPVLKSQHTLMSKQATATAAPDSAAAQAQASSPPVEVQQQQKAMQFKGDTESELHLVEILKSIIAYRSRIFEWGNKES